MRKFTSCMRNSAYMLGSECVASMRDVEGMLVPLQFQ